MASGRPRAAEIPRVLPRGRHKLQHSVVLASQRERLLEAIIELTAEKGFAAVTISDVVARAGTAKRTFYEHFPDKLQGLLAAFDDTTLRLIETTTRLFRVEGSPPERVGAALRGLLQSLAAMPGATRVFYVEAVAAGPEVIARRLEVSRLFAHMLMELSRETHARHPDIRELQETHALAVVGAINELIFRAIVERGPERLGELGDELAPLVVALLTAPVGAGSGPPARGAGRGKGTRKAGRR